MPKTEETSGILPPPPPPEPTPAVFTEKLVSPVHTFFAMMILLSCVYLIAILIVASFILLPLHRHLLVLGMLVVLMFIPVDENSKWGLALVRYIYKHMTSYFPATLYVEDIKDFSPHQAYVFGYEPHSVLPIGATTLLPLAGFMPTRKVKVLVGTVMLHTPFLRHLCTWLGTTKATREIFTSLLKAGCSCVVIPGGVQEAFYMEHDSEVAFLKERKGFIRLAMETDSPLVPVFGFGQSYIYNWWKPKGNFFLKLARAIKFMPIIFWGVLWSCIPLRRPILVVVGKPIHFKKFNSSPTMEEVSEVHCQYVEALQSLFDRHKARAGYPDLELRIM